MSDHAVLAQAVRAGQRLALARLLSLIENEQPQGEAALGELYPLTGRAYMVGVTGAPGTGKSSLVNELAKTLRAKTYPGLHGSRPPAVAIVAVDPTSPFSGGAILGDRIRMRDLAGDAGVFVRSMASRGSLGGLAHTTSSVADALDAAGFEVILIETVGAGQAEVDIARHAHTTLVIQSPGMGDDIQALKAGILEIADLLVVNKADLPGAENAVRVLRAALDLAGNAGGPAASGGTEARWQVPILQTVATTGQGVEQLVEALLRHREYLQASGLWRERGQQRVAAALDARLRDRLAERWHAAQPDGCYPEMLARVVRRELSPAAAVQEMLGDGPAPDSAARLRAAQAGVRR
ncbi:MAG: methylmalonyl Co-A mutase-associated GTPase MeaB [Chloroflexi bacterium]|nr:methylmalonyl Co-A mutase-associated GTPase MeaB [Chloroflexota bacterium]